MTPLFKQSPKPSDETSHASASERSAPADSSSDINAEADSLKQKVAVTTVHWIRIGYVTLLVLLWLVIMLATSFASPPRALFVVAMLSMLTIIALLLGLLLAKVRLLLGSKALYGGIAVSVLAFALSVSGAPQKVRFFTAVGSFDQVVTTLGPPSQQLPVGPDGQLVQWMGHCPATIGSYAISDCLLAPQGYLFYLNSTGIHEYAGFAYFTGEIPTEPMPQLLHTGGNYDNPPKFVPVANRWYSFSYTTR